VKAYTTRVGEGPFPTEFPDELMERIRTKGKEFGATTGRPRRCGWFDAVVARHAVAVNGCGSIAVTKLDVLDEMDAIQVCTGYRVGGRTIDDFPADAAVLERCQPIYESLPGWRGETGEAGRFDELPAAAQRYLKRLEELLGVPICLISTGSKREQAFKVGCW
jgi:adenylosuccinate synthase